MDRQWNSGPPTSVRWCAARKVACEGVPVVGGLAERTHLSLITVEPGSREGVYEVVACMHIELCVDARQVGLYGSLSDVQLLSDRLGGEALSGKCRDLAFPVGERGGAKAGGGRTLSRLAEAVEVGEDLVAAPFASAGRE